MPSQEIVKLRCTFTLEGSTEKIVDILEIEDSKVPFGVAKALETEYGVPVRSLTFYYI